MSTERDCSRIGRIVRAVAGTEEDTITCDDCYDHIDQYVELLEAGESPEGVLLQVQRHLEQCECCEYEMQALVRMIQSMQESDDAPPTSGQG
ncbi:MAG: hypothetical protein IT326_08620 [Anaerolineae bacterium]|nr:hypothetical protein [Anaerolineae bacterium]